ncbi:hypothetical protein C8R44DRAFT_367003 [Mycena epipterygia]|nr:hypothetical protein C8R44DRAFT_367003 [Mycena epipterygia]
MSSPPINTLRDAPDVSRAVERQDFVLNEAESQNGIFRGPDRDQIASALARVGEMSKMCDLFPYGQDEVRKLCKWIEDSLNANLSRSNGVSGDRREIVKARVKEPSQTDPGYERMDAFDNIVAGRMLFEFWATLDESTWLIHEKDIWDQLRRLGRISRDEGEEHIRTVTPTGSSKRDPNDRGCLRDSDGARFKSPDLQLHPLTADTAKDHVVKDCVERMDILSNSFPFGKSTVAYVLERLQTNFDNLETSQNISANDFNKKEEKLKERFLAELDHREKIRTARTQLDEMWMLIEKFHFGKDLAHRLYERLRNAISAEKNRPVFQFPSNSRNMAKDSFSNVAKGNKLFSQWAQQNSFAWVATEKIIWAALCSIGVAKIKQENRREWIEDVLRCGQTASLKSLDSLEQLDQTKKKAAKSLKDLAASPNIDSELRDKLEQTSSLICDSPVVGQPKKPPFQSQDAVNRAIAAHRLFVEWTTRDRDDLMWVIEEFNIWSEIHRLGSLGQNWKGKEWSTKWAEEVLDLAEKWVREGPKLSEEFGLSNPALASYRMQKAALSLRRIGNMSDVPYCRANSIWYSSLNGAIFLPK